MLGHMIEQIKPKSAATANDAVERSGVASQRCRRQIQGTIDELHALSRRGLWGILLFISLSAVTLYCSETGIFAAAPAEVKEIFGEAPPLGLLNIALGVSWLSAFILILGRKSEDGRPCYSWYNIGLPAAFYPLYIFSDPTGAYFPAVFAAGLTLLVIEHATVLCYTSRTIREESARLKELQG
jgi:hypothetical protein